MCVCVCVGGGGNHWRELPQVSSFVVTNTRLSRQARVCHDKTHLLSQQKYARRDKHAFVATKDILSRQKNPVMFVTTNVLR